MVKSAAGSPNARVLGAELRECREKARLSVRRLAQKLGVAHVRVARYESGTSVPDSEEVAAYLTVAGVSRTERERVLRMARDNAEPSRRLARAVGVHRELTTLIEFEQAATEITDVSPLLVPGLLQTPEYAKAVLGAAGGRITLRSGRHDLLARQGAPRLTAFVLEAALRQPLGGPRVMADQLRFLAKLAHHVNPAVRVIRECEQEPNPAHLGPFALFEFPKAAPIVHLQRYWSATFLYGRREVLAYQRAQETLDGLAMDPVTSRDFIAGCAEEMEHRAEYQP